jgi:hypothetical protein
MFALWINATTNIIVDRNKIDNASQNYERTLQFKVLRALLTFLS